MHKKFFIMIPVLLCAMIFSRNAYPISSSVKSSKDFAFTLEVIRNIRIMVENFGDEELKKKYSDIRALFQDASENFYGQDFNESALKFKKLKTDLISILASIDEIYLKRTKEILDSTSKETFDALIEYSRQSGMGEYFRKPYDPLKDVKPYDPDKFHLFYDKEKIESYLREGYKKYERAKSIYNDPEIATLRKKENLTVQNINYLITSFSEVVFLCREAKENGIEIHRVKNINELGKSLVKYNISSGTIIPIYDDRIPEKYKIDANDNRRLIHAVEMKKFKKKENNKQG